MSTIKYITCALALIIASVVTTTHATEYFNTAKIKYTNKGGYTACVNAYWNDSNDKKQKIRWDAEKNLPLLPGKDSCLDNGQSTIVDFAKVAEETQTTQRALKVGDEIWLLLNIKEGEKRNCHKDSPKFLYDPYGTTAEMKTSGTTLNNNRCEITHKK